MSSNVDSSTTESALHDKHNAGFEQVSREQWAALASAGLPANESDGDALQALQHSTIEGIPLEVLYDCYDGQSRQTHNSTAKSGIDNRVVVKHTDRAHINKSILNALQGGASSIELHINDAAQLASSLAGVNLEIAQLCLRTGHSYADSAKAFVEHATAQGLKSESIQTTLAADPIGLMLSGVRSEQTMAEQLKAMAEHAQWVSETLPRASSILIDVAVHHNAGASCVEELHAALATSVVYLEAMLESGMDITSAARQISFQVAMDSDVLLGVAKLRTLDALWQHLLTAMQTSDELPPNAFAVRVVAETSRRHLSLRQPWNNHLRSLAATTAAFIGGASTVVVNPHDCLQRSNQVQDDKLDNALDTELSDRMARNIPIILERECGLSKVADPMTGSYALENMTEQFITHTWQSLASTDTATGWLDEINSGRWQTRLSQTQNKRVAQMKHDERIAVGVNRYVFDGEEPTMSIEHEELPSPALRLVRDASVFENTMSNNASMEN